jgi:hypothetical protein
MRVSVFYGGPSRCGKTQKQNPVLGENGVCRNASEDSPQLSDGTHVAGTRALAAPSVFDNLKLDVLSFLQGIEGAVRDRRNVEEDVPLAGIGGNESKPAILHEFLDSALWHVTLPLIMKPR